MNCRAWQDLLQQQLDGDGPPGALDRHLHDCADCAAHDGDLRRFASALSRLRSPEPPAGLADRLTARLHREVRARRARAWRRALPLVGLAAAAAVLVVLGLWSWRPITGKPLPGQPGPGREIVQLPPRDEPPAPLRDSVSQAGKAVASLGQRTASDTLERTTTLVPLVRDPALDETARGSLAATPVEPKLEPLREAADGVSTGLAPVADSARRAVNLFFRDLPMSQGKPGTEKKPG